MLARHVLCAVGPWTGLADVDRAVDVYGSGSFFLDEESAVEHDPGLRESFAASACSVQPTLTPADLDGIDRHTAVVFVLSDPFPASRAREVSRRALAVVGALLDAGALGVKAESAGIAHGRQRWHRLAEQAAEGDVLALRDAFVRRPISDGTQAYSCGMHLLGRPDVEVEVEDPADALAWLDLVGAASLRVPRLTGGAVLLGPGGRRRLAAVPCTRYPSEDFFHNPHGYWRLLTS